MLHQVFPLAGEDSNEDFFNLYSLFAGQRVQHTDPPSGVKQVVDQDHGAMERFDGPHLIFQRGVIRERLDGVVGEVRGKYLVGVDGFCHGVGDGMAAQQLPEGYAHAGPQNPRFCGRYGYTIESGDFLHQAVMYHLRTNGEDQLAGIHGHQRHFEISPGFPDGIQNRKIVGKRCLDGGFHILQENYRRAHLHQPQAGIVSHLIESLTVQRDPDKLAEMAVEIGK